LIETIRIASYDHQDQDAARVLKGAHAGDGNGWLIIDDLVNIGATAKIVREWLPKAHFATIYAKLAGGPLVDTLIAEVSNDI
jgi:xanthine phosphoribosyltransferase